MNKQEKEAIDILENCIADYVIGDFCCGKYCPNEDMCKENDCPYETAIDVVVNLINKQNKELKKLRTENKNLKTKIKADYPNQESYVTKDKIKKDLEVCKEVYDVEIGPYQTEYGLDVTYLSNKEKTELVNKRNCLLTQMKTYEMLLED